MNQKHETSNVSFECKCKFDGTKCKLNPWQNNHKYQCHCKKQHIRLHKDYVWNPAACICENGKYLAALQIKLFAMRLKA